MSRHYYQEPLWDTNATGSSGATNAFPDFQQLHNVLNTESMSQPYGRQDPNSSGVTVDPLSFHNLANHQIHSITERSGVSAIPSKSYRPATAPPASISDHSFNNLSTTTTYNNNTNTTTSVNPNWYRGASGSQQLEVCSHDTSHPVRQQDTDLYHGQQQPINVGISSYSVRPSCNEYFPNGSSRYPPTQQYSNHTSRSGPSRHALLSRHSSASFRRELSTFDPRTHSIYSQSNSLGIYFEPDNSANHDDNSVDRRDINAARGESEETIMTMDHSESMYDLPPTSGYYDPYGYSSDSGSPRRKRVREEMTEIEDRMEEAEGRKQRMNELWKGSRYRDH
ncbi:hypothetical protein K435DRAFT_799909 [Dendrothele bispora CBS 962.96]|uniref:Uncharacterized protein n=1 Tax=Dendrothele bispora (strain CBS 962.96) TaxID=1314807 RepID=A0A4V6T5C3_DENBC|nr:hypothetical protein K435DRAFT_799909 [Dendrothele bispora CBS 962.96]